jgi:hypothetical protein
VPGRSPCVAMNKIRLHGLRCNATSLACRGCGGQRLAEGAGDAPSSAVPILFSGQVQPAYICLPSARMAARVVLAPTPNGLTGRRATFTPPDNGKLALSAGVAPASDRLGDECLSSSATAAFGNGRSSRTFTCDLPVPSRALWIVSYALRNWRIRRGSHPQPSRRQRVAPLIELRIRNSLPSRSLAGRKARPTFAEASLGSLR